MRYRCAPGMFSWERAQTANSTARQRPRGSRLLPRKRRAAYPASKRAAGPYYGWMSQAWILEIFARALPAAAKAAGVVLEEQTEIVAVDGSTGSVAITTSRGLLSAAAFVNCCGAWAAMVQRPRGSKGRIAGAPDSDLHPGAGPALSVVPRKGQMATVLMQGAPQLQHVVRTPEIYLVPRGDGRIAIGATVEDAGFDLQVEAAVVDRLVSQAAELWPPVRPAAVIDKWAGLRPGTRDDLPLIGSAGPPNCWLATGHFRNGILLAPATGRVVRQLLEGKPTDAAMDAFALERLSSR